MKKDVSNEELNNVSGGRYPGDGNLKDGTCKGCGKFFATNSGLTPVYIENGCRQGWWKYYCDVCGGEIEFTWLDNDPSW